MSVQVVVQSIILMQLDTTALPIKLPSKVDSEPLLQLISKYKSGIMQHSQVGLYSLDSFLPCPSSAPREISYVPY